MPHPFPFTQYQVHHFLLARCPVFRPAPPWDFLPADADCRSTVADAPATLAALTDRYPVWALESARVVERGPRGEVRLRPELCNPVGALVGLREHPRSCPHGLLTARGCLPDPGLLIATALADGGTASLVSATGLLFAPFRIREVALLRGLRMPVTLCPRFRGLTVDQLRAVDRTFGGEQPSGPGGGPAPGAACPPEAQPPPPAPPDPDGGIQTKPLLVLLGWSPLSASDQQSPLLPRVATHLAAVRKHIGLELAGVVVWRPSPATLANLRFRMGRRDASLVQELLLESTDELYDFEHFGEQDGGPGPGAAPLHEGYAAAQAQLLATLAGERAHGRHSHRVQAAWRAYEAIVQRDLVSPLQEWALGSYDPVIRAAGLELASLSGMLHQTGPILHELQSRQLERAAAGDGEPFPPKLLTQYLQLSSRFGSLLRDLSLWRKS